MNEMVDWQEWLKPYEQERGYPFMARSIAALIASEKSLAVWISGSRATRQADQYSDIDIRVHAPTWKADDLTSWLREVDPMQRALVRLSKLSPNHWNYECLFAGIAPIDLLVFTVDAPVLSIDSMVFKGAQSLERAPAFGLIKETAVTPTDVRNLVDGAIIDQRKFTKLLVRGERLAARFLLDGQRFTALRLGYIAARGVDCGGKQQHTLASLKLLYELVAGTETNAKANGAAALNGDGTLEEGIFHVEAFLTSVVAKLDMRFPEAAVDHRLAGP
jgi:hypothetical protein